MIQASHWVRTLVATRAQQELLTGAGLALFAVGAAFVTTFVVFGLFLMMGVVLASLGIVPPHPTIIAPVAIAIQLTVFYATKPKEVPAITVERTEDTGELIVVKPHRSQRPGFFYNQEGAGTLRQIVATIFLSTAVAIHETWKRFHNAMQIRRTDTNAVAQLTDYLLSRGTSATLEDIQRAMPRIDLPGLLPQLDRLPGFNLIMGDQQGVSLTDNAMEGMAG
jgi:hypothetical protein